METADRSIREIRGIGEKTADRYQKLGIRTVSDLIHYYPRSYDLFGIPLRAGEVRSGRKNAVEGMIRMRPSVRTYGGKSITMLSLKDETGELQVNWFHMPYLKGQLKPGQHYVLRGQVIQKGNRRILEQPKIFRPQAYRELQGRMNPVYSLTRGLTNDAVSKAVRQALEMLDPDETEFLPEGLRMELRLTGEENALRQIHFPESEENFRQAHERLVFDEFFLFLLEVSRQREQGRREKNAYRMQRSWKTEQVIQNLPYHLTEGQQRVLEELESDLSGAHRMHRLIQGDVGSGKTILAFLAMIMAEENGFQSALMVPTEVLARQHFESLVHLLEENGMDPSMAVLLTGSAGTKAKREAEEKIAAGGAKFIIGTHALIQEKVRYSRLALVITDEQHRFGVRQRETLSGKGMLPNVLVMSATPIPRTLAMILYGDLDISTLEGLPARRRRVLNAVIGVSGRPAAFRFIRKETDAGHQAYVICPMIEPNEELPLENVEEYTNKLRAEFGGRIRVGMLHGRMKNEEKNRIMEEFAEGSIQVLVSTTVVEVGVNVPNATVMMVENAERFGLAQLHQLRGRVGRGEAQSYCIFVQGGDDPEPSARLKILQETNDGFRIAGEDLKLRGPGDLLGIRQSGTAAFRLADIYQDSGVLLQADRAVRELLQADPDLERPENRKLKNYLERYKMTEFSGAPER